MINFVSNLPHDLRSGGFSAMNASAFATLRADTAVHYAGPINPPIFLPQKVLSKFLRVAGSQGDFFFFSRRRLQVIAHEVRERCRADARMDFFHGFTPWILTRPERPYIAYSDCTFRDYIGIFHRREQFRERDLRRIEQAEALWLRNARLVLLRSEWAAKRAVTDYALDARRVASVGGFGEIEVPARDAYAGGKQFAFVSTNFAAKGGAVVLSAFRQVRQRHPDASLAIIGDQPARAAREPGVEFLGYLRKEVPAEVERLKQILSLARALVHPTTGDVSPLIIVEAGYFGCPAISSRRFAIPEVVQDGHTGLLLDDPSRVDGVARAMNWMLEAQEQYLQMRHAAWAKAHGQHSKRRFEERLLSFVSGVVSGAGIPVS